MTITTNINAQKTQNEKTQHLGTISGEVLIARGGYCGCSPLAFAVVKTENKNSISKPITGEYKINELQLEKQHTITISHPNFKTKTKNVTLTTEKPDVKINIIFTEEDIKTKHQHPRQTLISNILQIFTTLLKSTFHTT